MLIIRIYFLIFLLYFFAPIAYIPIITILLLGLSIVTINKVEFLQRNLAYSSFLFVFVSFFIMIKYGKEIFVFFIKKTYFILVFTYFFIFLFLLFSLLEIKNDIIYYSSLLYFILLVSNISLMKFIFSTLKFKN